jgi:hypothetical protein
MSVWRRVVFALGMVPVVGFCPFGFLATYEPPGFPVWRAFYGLTGVAGMVAVAATWARPGRRGTDLDPGPNGGG